MNTIQFVDELPPATRASHVGQFPPASEVAASLRSAEGKWAKIRTYSKDRKASGYVFASQCRSGKIKSLSKAQGFEIETRTDPETRELHVYARFVGDFR